MSSNCWWRPLLHLFEYSLSDLHSIEHLVYVRYKPWGQYSTAFSFMNFSDKPFLLLHLIVYSLSDLQLNPSSMSDMNLRNIMHRILLGPAALSRPGQYFTRWRDFLFRAPTKRARDEDPKRCAAISWWMDAGRRTLAMREICGTYLNATAKNENVRRTMVPAAVSYHLIGAWPYLKNLNIIISANISKITHWVVHWIKK